MQYVAILWVRRRKKNQLPRDELSVHRDIGNRMGIAEDACEGGERLDEGVVAKAIVGYDDGVDGIFCSTTTMPYRSSRQQPQTRQVQTNALGLLDGMLLKKPQQLEAIGQR